MKKTYAVIGLGRFGTAVAERLYALGNEVLVVDNNAERVQRMESRVTYAVVADARDEEVLRSLAVRNYDCAVVATGSDLAASIVITMNLKELGVPQVICKAEGDTQKRALEKVGADKVVIPEREAGVKLAQKGDRPITLLDLATHRFGPDGLYVLDEPEAALSVPGCLALVARIHDLVRAGSQFVVATHSPVLLAVPGATILRIGDDGTITKVTFDEADPVALTRSFLDDPQRFLRHLL